MPLGHFVLSTDVSLRANMTVEAEINAFDDEYDVRIEELRNEPYFDETALKITKIEYQKIVGQRRTLFGHTGNVSKSYLDGQIKITVNGEKSDQSLKELFDGKKQ